MLATAPSPALYRIDHARTLGVGSSGEVKLATNFNGAELAVKIVPKAGLSCATKQNLVREVQAMRTLKHQNIVQLHCVKEDRDYIYMFMEYVHSDMCHVLTDIGRFEEYEAKPLFRQIVDALAYMHSRDFVHRDVKLENILVNKERTQVRLIDFGFCTQCPKGKYLTSFCGSPSFVAPEILRRLPYDGRATDVWGLGIILFGMLFGCLPFGDDQDIDALFHNILACPLEFPENVKISQEAKHLLRCCLSKSPQHRPSITEILRCSWLNGDTSL